MNHPEKEKIWEIPQADAAWEEQISPLSRQTGHSEIVTRLLFQRGYRSAEEIESFLHCGDTFFHSPFLLRDMENAVARIRRAVENGEKIVIYGDYDVDGETSVSLLYLYLSGLHADVGYYIPNRNGEGYGLSATAIDRFAKAGVTCMVTVDTGITANKETLYAAEKGIDTVITDHHECRLPLPQAVAVVNPHRPDCEYPFRELAGVGVVFKLICAYESMLASERGEKEIDSIRRICALYADLVAIGTIADVMPLTGENRLIVKLGLSQIARNNRKGIAALMDEMAGPRAAGESRERKKKITASFIGFGIAPRLNAAGRMSEASLSVELLLSDTEERARELAAELCEINRQRQSEENRVAEQAYRRIGEEPSFAEDRVLVLEDDSWRQGILGIVSSRITENFGRPSVLISFDGATRGFDSPDDIGKGSGRSVKGMNLVEALIDSEDLLVKFGGHEMAAGLSIRRDQVQEFRKRINAYAEKCLPSGGVPVCFHADGEIALSDVTLSLAEELSTLEPFGVANPTPQFVVRSLTVERITELCGGKHLKLTVRSGDRSLYALCFSTTRSQFGFREGDQVDLLCTPDINEYGNTRSVQLIVQDYKPGAELAATLECERARYQQVRSGGSFARAECFVPERNDFARVYTVLRREFRAGNDIFRESTLLSLVNLGNEQPLNYICLRVILDVFRELQICGVEECGDGVYHFDIYFNASKTNIEKSSILRKLKSQCRDRS